jgi:dihydrofolate reductase
MALVSLIFAIAENGVIGRDNALPWHLPEDLRWFRQQTLGKPIVMGRRTFESIGRALPGRRNIVVSRDAAAHFEGAVAADGLDAALAAAEADGPVAEIVVIGGRALFEAALPRAGRLYLTRVHRSYEGDVRLSLDTGGWRTVSIDDSSADGDKPALSFEILERA